MKLSKFSRFLFFLTALLASYQVSFGVDGMRGIPITAYTLGFGTLLISCLMVIILGYDAFENSTVAIISTVIPLSLSLGLVWDFLTNLRYPYLLFTLLGFLTIVITRLTVPDKAANYIHTCVHGTAGLTIFFIPIIVVLRGLGHPVFLGVSIGGGLTGIGGLMLYLMKSDKSILPSSMILEIFPVLLFFATLAFVFGFTSYF